MPPLRRLTNWIRGAASDGEVPSEFLISIEAGGDPEFTLLEAADGEGEQKLRRFRMTAYTGGRLLLANFPYPVVVDLSGIKVPSRARPIFRDHKSDRIVGHTTSVKVNAGSIQLEGIVSGANEHAREVLATSDNGFPWEASIGAMGRKMAFVDRGETVEVNGRKFTGPLYVARQSTLKEVSFVALGGDENGATATLAATSASEQGSDDMGFEAWIKAKGFDAETLTEEARTFLRAQYDAEQSSDDDPPAPPIAATGDDSGSSLEDDIADQRRERGREIARVKAINALARQFSDVTIDVDGEQVDLEAHAIEAGWSAERTELHYVRNSRPQAPAGHSGSSRDDINGPAIEAALLLSTNHSEEFVARHYDEQAMNAALSRQYRSFTLHGLMATVIRAAGHHYHGSYKSNDFIRAMKKADREILAGGFSTLSVSNVLESVANKSLINSYEMQEVVWPFFCAVKSYSDFKVQNRYRLDASGSFKKVGADGELKHVSLTDAKYTNQLDTYGAIIALSRQQMINDDLDAFLEIPRLLGQMGSIRKEEAFFVLLLGNSGSFFGSGNNNYDSGAGTALQISSLTTGEQRFRDQLTPNNKPVLISPTRLLVPTPLKVTADNLYNETVIIATDHAASASTTAPARNPHAGKYLPHTSPYLNNTSITDQDGNAISGQSSTGWYLFADPNVRAAVIMGTLNGQRMPTIESDETSFETLGMQWRAYDDFGVGFEDPVAAYLAAGA